jgi:hypothetical protein
MTDYKFLVLILIITAFISYCSSVSPFEKAMREGKEALKNKDYEKAGVRDYSRYTGVFGLMILFTSSEFNGAFLNDLHVEVWQDGELHDYGGPSSGTRNWTRGSTACGIECRCMSSESSPKPAEGFLF